MPKKPTKSTSPKKRLGRATMRKTRGGSMARPQVDDEVLIAFESGDIRKPVVLGSLWSKDSPPPTERK